MQFLHTGDNLKWFMLIALSYCIDLLDHEVDIGNLRAYVLIFNGRLVPSCFS